MDLTTQTGAALQDGLPLPPEAATEHVQTAWRHWINDQFWLNPFSNLFTEGVERSLVPTVDGNHSLLVTFTRGGATPGDAYLLSVDADGLPTAWKMWVSILPLGGLTASWEDWIVLESGALISQPHQIGPIALRLRKIAGGSVLTDLASGTDPFLPLLTGSLADPAQ